MRAVCMYVMCFISGPVASTKTSCPQGLLNTPTHVGLPQTTVRVGIFLLYRE